MDDSNELVKIPIVKMKDVLLARFVIRKEAERLKFSASEITALSTATSEIARNAMQYASDGSLEATLTRDGEKEGIRIIIADKGDGIEDLDKFLNAESTMGSGIPGSRSLMDDFNIQTGAGEGTTVTMVKWKG